MSLFHKRVISKYSKNVTLATDDEMAIVTAWSENLRNGVYDVETQNDGEFIQRILIDVLGYRGNIDGVDWNVAKNEPVGKGNVDVALGLFSTSKRKIVAPFELKGARTKDLDATMAGRNKSPVQQAWEYAMDAKGAQWVIVSNYRVIRLYAVGYGRKDYEIFDLSKLSDPIEFAKFRLLLSPEGLLGGKSLELLTESDVIGKNITNQLYSDYKDLRSNIINDIRAENTNVTPLQAIHSTQTILDRILFVAFAEDTGLLPKNTLENAYETQNKYSPVPIWKNFEGLFHAINKGNAELKIPEYNGGLFASNDVLDGITLSDNLCHGFKKLGEYDFSSDVSVNILGHIFEQSVSDIEDLKADAQNADAINPKKSKRKADGIFYTPPYVTRLIVENAVGSWLSDKKLELGFSKLAILNQKDYDSIKSVFRGRGKKRTLNIEYNKKIATHIQAWESYKECLSSIKVLDPACGSGAFLNEVFDYLKSEGELVNAELAIFRGEQTALFRWDTHILENNIYGVDLNSESVEITKLSLWLKTANAQEKLTYLENNIKVGNSLIDSSDIAGKDAFDWSVEFGEVIESGGFDVIVGNPPYGASLGKNEKQFIKSKYASTPSSYDTYISFYELSLMLLKENAYFSFITPNTFLVTENALKIRQLLLRDNSLISLLEIFNVFPDAIVETVVALIRKSIPCDEHKVSVITTPRGNYKFSEKIELASESKFSINQILQSEGIVFNYRAQNEQLELVQKIQKDKSIFGDIFEIKAGTKLYEKGKGIPLQTKMTLVDKPYTSFVKETPEWSVLVRGTDIRRYGIVWQGEYVHYGEWLAAPRNKEIFFNPKIFIRRTDDKILATIDGDNIIGVNSVHCAQLKENNNIDDLHYYLALLNSKLLTWVFQFNNFHMVGKPLAEVKVVFITRLPVPVCDKKQRIKLGALVKKIMRDQSALDKLSAKFITLLKTELSLDKVSRKMEIWFQMNVSEFSDELNKLAKKSKLKLNLSERSEWITHFEHEKKGALEIVSRIDSVDSQIDGFVYKLFGLTAAEISVVDA